MCAYVWPKLNGWPLVGKAIIPVSPNRFAINSKRPFPFTHYPENTDDVYVGRIRRDLGSENGLLLWIVADNLLRGAAVNACSIVSYLLKR